MKAKLLLCMMLLAMLCASAQPPTPRVLKKSYQVTPTSPSLTPKVINGNNFLIPSLQPNDFKSDKVNINHIKAFDCKKTIAEGAPTQQVKLSLDFDNTQPIISLRMINWIDEFELSWHREELSQGLNNLDIPTGTYDIIAVFWQYPFDYEAATSQGLQPENLLFVIREQVVIDQDMQIDIAASDAKNHIKYQTLTIDGEPVSLGKWFVDENWYFEEVEPANVYAFDYVNYLYCSDYGSFQRWEGSLNAVFEGAIQRASNEQLADFYVSDVSPRFAFYSYRVFSKDNGVFTTAYETMGASKDTTFNNDPANYTLFEDSFNNDKRHQNEERFLSYTYSVQHPDNNIGYFSHIATNIEPLLPDESIKTYIGTDIDYSQAGFYPFIETAASIRTANGVSQPLTIAKPYKKDGEIQFDNTGSTFYDMVETATKHFRQDCSLDPPRFYPIMLPPPDYTFSADKKKDILGNSCPLLTSNPMHYYIWTSTDGEIDGQFFVLEFPLDYTGRYGELLVDDAVHAQVIFKLNDEELFSTQGSFIAQGPEPIVDFGPVDVDIINEGFLVDDIAGSNKAQLHYTSGADDENPPTMTMLLFKSNDGDVTDRFATAEEGILEFTAGDFNESAPRFFDDRQAPESVEVSYSPYGEDNWNELPVEEVPENYWPVMGWFYTGSLAGVTGQGLNGWFDLKIRLTDAAGNWQEQVLSPAFRIDDLAYSSVATIAPNDKSDNAIYNLAGQRMRGDLNSLPHGVYIVGGKKVVK